MGEYVGEALPLVEGVARPLDRCVGAAERDERRHAGRDDQGDRGDLPFQTGQVAEELLGQGAHRQDAVQPPGRAPAEQDDRPGRAKDSRRRHYRRRKRSDDGGTANAFLAIMSPQDSMSRANRDLAVTDLMSTALITAKPKDLILRAEKDMAIADIRHLPVVDDRNRLVGIVSNRDLLRAIGGGKRRLIGEVMTSKVRVVRPDTPAREAAQLMISHKIGALPVVGDEMELVGIITETDFLQVAVRALGGTPIPR